MCSSDLRARDLRLDRVVAVKMLHPWVATDDDARRRFHREATTLAQLRHPNVVQVLDFDDALPAPFLVQEHCGGGTLGGGVSAQVGVGACASSVTSATAPASTASGGRSARSAMSSVWPMSVASFDGAPGDEGLQATEIGRAHV